MPNPPPSFIEVQYQRLYFPDRGGAGLDYWLYVHPNGIALVGLAAAHPYLKAALAPSADADAKQNTEVLLSSLQQEPYAEDLS